MKLISKYSMLAFCIFLLATVVLAQEKKYYTNEPSKNATDVFFGDPHIHTVMSMDAAAWGTNQTPSDTYRYAKGEEVTTFKEWKAKLTRPLDWTVIADHSDGYDFTTW